MTTYDEFPDPVPIIREWIKNNRVDALTLAQFNGLAQQAAARDPIGEGMLAWLSIAFAAGREYGETKQASGNTSLVISHTSMVGDALVRRKVTFSADTIDDYAPMLLAIEQAINVSGELRAHVTVEES